MSTRKNFRTPSLKITSASGPKNRRATIILSTENHRRLGILAALRGCDRSQLVNEALDIHLAGVRGYAPSCEPAEETAAG